MFHLSSSVRHGAHRHHSVAGAPWPHGEHRRGTGHGRSAQSDCVPPESGALADAGLPAPADRPEPAESSFPLRAAVAPLPAIRIFACAGKPCRNGQGGWALIHALQREIAYSGPEAAHIEVRPCGCLDRCKEGPVAIAYRGKAAQASRPPHGVLDKLVHRPIKTFVHATPAEARHIIDTLMKKRP